MFSKDIPTAHASKSSIQWAKIRGLTVYRYVMQRGEGGEIDTTLKRYEKLNYEKKKIPTIKPIKNYEFTLEF